MAVSPMTGILVERFGVRTITCTGTVICGISLLTTSFIAKIGQIFATFSILYGIGTSMAYTPTFTICPTYFDKYLSIATGLMSAGTSTGTLIFSPLGNVLFRSLGWRNTMRMFTAFTVIAACCTYLFKPNEEVKSHRLIQMRQQTLVHQIIEELSIWKNSVFVVWSMAITFVSFGIYIPYVHLIAFAKDLGISQSKGSLLIMILGTSTTVGRIFFGQAVDFHFMDRLHLQQLSMIATGTAMMMLYTVKTFEGLIVYVVSIGLLDGCIVVLLPLMTATFFGNDKAGIAWGFVCGACSVTVTLGPPVCAWFYAYEGTYNLAFHVAGIPSITGAVILLFIPWAQNELQKQKNAKAMDLLQQELILLQEEEDDESRSDESIDVQKLSRESSIPGSLSHSQMTEPFNLASDAGSVTPVHEDNLANVQSLTQTSRKDVSKTVQNIKTLNDVIGYMMKTRAKSQDDGFFKDNKENAKKKSRSLYGIHSPRKCSVIDQSDFDTSWLLGNTKERRKSWLISSKKDTMKKSKHSTILKSPTDGFSVVSPSADTEIFKDSEKQESTEVEKTSVNKENKSNVTDEKASTSFDLFAETEAEKQPTRSKLSELHNEISDEFSSIRENSKSPVDLCTLVENKSGVRFKELPIIDESESDENNADKKSQKSQSDYTERT